MLRVFAFGLIIIPSLIGSICTQYVSSESGIAATMTSFLWASAGYQASPIDAGQGKVNSLLTMRQKPEPVSGFLPSKIRDQQENAGTNLITASQSTAGQTLLTPRMPETIPIRYVSKGGSDTNDGLSWATAKHTIYGALVSLPGGGRNTAGSGTIYVGTGSSANPISGAGIWLMGSGDPNYANPPAGWLKCGTCILDIIGVANDLSGPNAHTPKALVNAGNYADRNHPAIWISSNAHPIRFQNLGLGPYNGRGIVLGECSNNARNVNSCGTTVITFENVAAFTHISGQPTFGPCTDVVGANFWIWFRDFGCSANADQPLWSTATITQFANSGGVTTATCSALYCGLGAGFADYAILNSNALPACQGEIFVKSVSGNTMTFNSKTCPRPNGMTTGTWALAIGGNYKANNGAAILFDGSTGNGNGLIYINDTNLDNGGIKFIPGYDGGTIFVKNTIEEGCCGPIPPTVWFTSWNLGTGAILDGIFMADQQTSAAVIENDATNTNYGAPLVIGSGPIVGPAILIGGVQSTTISPLRNQQYGINGTYLVGETDVARRIAGLIPTRFANKAYSSTASWTYTNTSGVQTFKQGLSDPFGGTGAASITSTSVGNQQLSMAVPLNVTPSAGDWLVEGVWVKGAWAPAASVYLIGNCAGYGYPTTSATYYNSGLQIGDGQWQYVWFANKFVGGTGNTYVCMTGQFNSGAGPTLYGPTMYYISARTLSDNEVLEFASSMNSVDPRCQVGQICNVSGHPVVVSSYGTLSNCSSVTSPAKCDSAPAGSFVLGVGSTTATVNTTAVTAYSQILIIEDSSLGAKLGVFCSKATGRTYMITDRAPGLSFTISSSFAPADHPACLSFQLLN